MMKKFRQFLLIVVLVLAGFATAHLVTPAYPKACPSGRGCKAERPNTKPGNMVVNSIGMKLAYIPAGVFEMGSPPEEKGRQDDEFRHRVKLTRPFRIGVTEVTQAQWDTVMSSNHSHFKGKNLPVEKVSWKEAVAFCKKLSDKQGRTYRLPTEAEWEYACRAGATGAFLGTGNIDDMAWYEANSEEQTHSVTTKKANAWGLYDMHGNVSEWCSDRYKPDYPEVAIADPTGPTEARLPKGPSVGQGKYRVVRGGSWGYFARSCRCAARLPKGPPTQRSALQRPAYPKARPSGREVKNK